MVEAFPALSDGELAEACAILEKNASDRLDGTDWLGLTWNNDSGLHIKKRYLIEEGTNENGTRESDRMRETSDIAEEEEEDDDDDDESTLQRPATALTIVVDFCVHISPTYRVPTLWFTLTGLPPHAPGGIDAVYHYIVPPTFKAQVDQIGVGGGVSMAHHPVSDVPACFIHPCNTQEALLSIHPGCDLSPYDYLLLWLGLVGPSVGLYVPSQLVRAG